jgi:hypothetical protein
MELLKFIATQISKSDPAVEKQLKQLIGMQWLPYAGAVVLFIIYTWLWYGPKPHWLPCALPGTNVHS